MDMNPRGARIPWPLVALFAAMAILRFQDLREVLGRVFRM